MRVLCVSLRSHLVNAHSLSLWLSQALSRLTSLEVLQLDKHDDPEGGEADGGAPAAFSIPPESMVLLAQGWAASLHTLDLYNITPTEMPEAVRKCIAYAHCANRS